ncbi:hypothetical protein ACFY0F_03965 [Streptomyces sp. NPDC001544]|jgi:hypothetical protein|uniref:hypothetical protein n=1 Tax=Streptomyces sp. NPDC001544 TaxID=3364584 RepID=UPI0036D181DD
MALFLFLILVAIILGLIGVAAKGLFWLLVIGAVVLVADLVLFGVRWSRHHGHHVVR